MAMKKRFLGLAMSAAMVIPATTVYASGNQTVQFNSTDEYNHEVKVSGIVRNDAGEVPAGKIEVELPTAMNFTVAEDGKFYGSKFTVTNKSEYGIDVFVEDFKRGNGDIEVKTKEVVKRDAQSLNRSNVYLELNGDQPVDLGSIKDLNTENKKVLNVDANNSGLIMLNGGAGQAPNDEVDTNGASGDFTLLFKIKKESN